MRKQKLMRVGPTAPFVTALLPSAADLGGSPKQQQDRAARQPVHRGPHFVEIEGKRQARQRCAWSWLYVLPSLRSSSLQGVYPTGVNTCTFYQAKAAAHAVEKLKLSGIKATAGMFLFSHGAGLFGCAAWEPAS
ncbi:hypothetical protein GUJ93_ZPchr0006g44932 [Zizania palustris]|uniref:Uncharacterized protein n=1 Tax=Zizania palustris TaxID=103762 RepID=A0A8J5TAS9_ZIZPA|nr:hypothetical protein GUJ93_ZPchr0006g44932 [Zizania palustris]